MKPEIGSTWMQRLTANEFFAITGVTRGTFKVAVSRGEAALAFGLSHALAGGLFLDLDVVSWMLVDELTPAFTRKFAAVIVRKFSDVWCRAVARVDRTEEPIFLGVTEVGEPLGGTRRSYREGVNVDCGTLAEWGANELRQARAVPERMTLINITSVLGRARQAAAAINVDLSAPFCPALDDPKFEQAMRDAKTARERHVTRVAARPAR